MHSSVECHYFYCSIPWSFGPSQQFEFTIGEERHSALRLSIICKVEDKTMSGQHLVADRGVVTIGSGSTDLLGSL